MSEFNKIYVNCVRDESLHGKYGYFADDIDTLRHYVTELRYNHTDMNKPVQDIMVRKWDDDVWYVPSATYLGLDN